MSIFFDTYKRDLARIGIVGAKARFYLSALELGEETVSAVAKHCGATRTNAYALLEKCLEDGLVTQVQRGKKTFIVAEHPSVLLRNLDDKREALASFLPNLTRLYQSADHRPRLRVYDGVEGVRSVLNYVADAQSDEILGILSMKELQAFPGFEEFEFFITKRIHAGKQLRVIRSASEETDAVWETSASDLRTVRYTATPEPLVMTTFIYDDSVAVISSERENFSMVVESPEFSKVQRSLFEALWQNSQAS